MRGRGIIPASLAGFRIIRCWRRCAEPMFILHGWLRSGNTTAGRGVVAFLTEALALLPAGWSVRAVRADSGFFDGKRLEFLEERKLPYIVVARLTGSLKRAAAGLKD